MTCCLLKFDTPTALVSPKSLASFSPSINVGVENMGKGKWICNQTGKKKTKKQKKQNKTKKLREMKRREQVSLMC